MPTGTEEVGVSLVWFLISENKNYGSIIYLKIKFCHDDLLVTFPNHYTIGFQDVKKARCLVSGVIQISVPSGKRWNLVQNASILLS